MQYRILAPATNERSPRYMEKALASIHQGLSKRATFSLKLKFDQDRVALLVDAPQNTATSIVEAIQANYPDSSVAKLETEDSSSNLTEWVAYVQLVPDVFPILRHAQFEDSLQRSFADPIGGLLKALSTEDFQSEISIHVQRASRARRHRAINAVKLLDRMYFRTHHKLARLYARHAVHKLRRWLVWPLARVAKRSPAPAHTPLDITGGRIHDREDDVQAAADKIGGHLFEVSIRISVRVPKGHNKFAVQRLRAIAGALGAFTRSRLATFEIGRLHKSSNRTRRPTFLMSHEELATLWHPPTANVNSDRLYMTEFQELPPPVRFHSEKESGGVVVGSVCYREDRRPAVLGLEDRRRHMYVIGKTGMGKTTLLQNMIVSDIQQGYGVCILDPHGDLAEAIVHLVPSHRTNDVIYFDAPSKLSGVRFNPLACHDPAKVDQVTSGVVSAFRKLNDSWGPRLEDTLRNAIHAIVEQKGDLLSVMRLLGESSFREQIVPNIKDEIVRSFWVHEFAQWSTNYRTEAVAAIQNKIRPFLTNSIIRSIVSESKNCIDLRKLMDTGKVLIVNLSKGRLGDDNSTLLGAFLVTSLQQAALTRADIPEANRRDFFLYVDEFQNFTTGSFASVLSEARKFRLSLVVANQYLKQLNEQTANAVFGNVGSIISFQIGSDDAEIITQQLGKFAGQINACDLAGLPKFTAYARLLIDGLPSNPFSIHTLPPQINFDAQRAETIQKQMMRRFVPQFPISTHSQAAAS